MAEFGDPGFQRHVATAQVWGLVALTLSEAKDLPLDYQTYGKVLQEYVDQIQQTIIKAGGIRKVNLQPLEKALGRLQEAAKKIEVCMYVCSLCLLLMSFSYTYILIHTQTTQHERRDLRQQYTSSLNSITSPRALRGDRRQWDEGSFVRLREFNDRLMLAERGFLDSDGINGRGEAAYRAWLKHLVSMREWIHCGFTSIAA